MAMNQVIPGITSPNKLTIPVGSRDHIQGLIDAPISLLEFGDYECPACGQAYRVVKAVQQSLGNRQTLRQPARVRSVACCSGSYLISDRLKPRLTVLLTSNQTPKHGCPELKRQRGNP